MKEFPDNYNKVKEYLKNILCFNGNFTYNIITGDVELKDSLFVTRLTTNILNDEILAIKLHSGLKIFFSDVCFTSLHNFPLFCKTLIIDNMHYLKKDIEIKTISNELSITNCFQIQSIKTINPILHICNSSGNKRIGYQNIALSNVEFYVNSNNIDLTIIEAPNINSFDQIKTQSNVFKNLILRNCGITALQNKEYYISDCCSLSLPLKNFIGIDKFNVGKSLTIELELNNCDNIINLLYNNSRNIIIKNDILVGKNEIGLRNFKVSEILRKYLVNTLRKDYIMDCAIELIENGFTYAAEL